MTEKILYKLIPAQVMAEIIKLVDSGDITRYTARKILNYIIKVNSKDIK